MSYLRLRLRQPARNDARRTASTTGGFTLIETLVAVTILVTSVTTVLTVVQRSVALGANARSKTIAFYLAQEPIEYIRNTRDTNKMDGRDWLNGFAPCINAFCTVDPRYDRPESAPGIVVSGCGVACPVLFMEASSGLYGYAKNPGWNETIYYRDTMIENPPSGGANPDEARIVVTVRWSRGFAKGSVTVIESIFDW